VRESVRAGSASLLEKEENSVLNSKAVARKNYWESHPGLAQIGERYLSRAKIRRESGGLVFSVPTNFHLKAIQPWKEVIETTLGEKIIGFEILREEKKATDSYRPQEPAGSGCLGPVRDVSY
jgi:hypothetical protein